MYNRRELAKITFAGLAAPLLNAYAFTRSSDLAPGVQTRSFRDLRRAPAIDPIETLIGALAACDAHDCELFAPQIEAQFAMSPRHHGMSSMARQMMRREQRKWRLRTPVGYFQAIGRRFEKAGIAIAAFNYSPDASFTDEEIDAGFVMAKALGAGMITASTPLDVAARIAPFADRHRTIVALHGDSRLDDPNAIGSPERFAAALRLSRYFKISLDLGNFTAANFDPLEYLREHHRDVANLRLKDRRRNQGEDQPWGRGDTPIRDVLRLVKNEMWRIRGYVDYEYAGEMNSIDEVKKCLAYATAAAV
jgi:sugar phosphate isomerase/epimerase